MLFRLGAIHDDSSICQKISRDEGVMSSVLLYPSSYVLGPWTWTRCSAVKVAELMNQGRGNCMLRSRFMQRSVQPIMVERDPDRLFDSTKGDINPHQQCQLVFGKDSMNCRLDLKCSKLWCQTYNNQRRKMCATRHQPWADGTSCGSGRECYHSKCTNSQYNPVFHKKEIIDGQWSRWSSWTGCSYTCNGGIRLARRTCDNPKPANGGANCYGSVEKVELCNYHIACNTNQDRRELQCDKIQREVRKRYPQVDLKPKWNLPAGDECQLHCIDPLRSWMNQNPGFVSDGTQCSRKTNDICIHGICNKIGCDGRLNSNVKRDNCWVCDGDNSSCRPFRDRFYPRGTGFVEVTNLPKGSVGVKITQQQSYASDGITLALYDKVKRKRIFNGAAQRNRLEMAEWYDESPLVIDYSGYSDANEKIEIAGKLPVDLQLQVYKSPSSSRRYGIIDVAYYEPASRRISYEWSYSGI